MLCLNKSKKNGKLLISHRSTTYPCCLPALGDSAGAGRIRLAAAKISVKPKAQSLNHF